MASDRGRLISLYERVAELGERELELVRTGQYEQLEPLHAEREDLIAVLPDAPPAEASTALLRAAAVPRCAVTRRRFRSPSTGSIPAVKAGVGSADYPDWRPMDPGRRAIRPWRDDRKAILP